MKSVTLTNPVYFSTAPVYGFIGGPSNEEYKHLTF